MCGRYELKATARDLIRHFQQLRLGPREMPHSDEISPMDSVLILSCHSEGYFGSNARWGLVGKFLDAEPHSPIITLRSEGLATTPFYSKILKQKRCLIPATAFFEWQNLANGTRQKIRISHPKGAPLMLAGVFDHHPQAGTTCAILTTEANTSLQPLQTRMPLILTQEECAFWLQEHAEFPNAEFAAIIQPSSRCALKLEAVNEEEYSPQLSLAFA